MDESVLTGETQAQLSIAQKYDFRYAVWLSLFHSISAWNNAGFGLFKDNLMSYQSSIVINLAITGLIIFGGIGYQLYTKETATLIWEYAGDDEDPGSYSQPQTPENFLYSGETSDFNGNDPENPQLETLTLDELFNRLQNDPTLAGQMAEQLGIENKDAESIIDSLIAQFSPQEAKTPETYRTDSNDR